MVEPWNPISLQQPALPPLLNYASMQCILLSSFLASSPGVSREKGEGSLGEGEGQFPFFRMERVNTLFKFPHTLQVLLRRQMLFCSERAFSLSQCPRHSPLPKGYMATVGPHLLSLASSKEHLPPPESVRRPGSALGFGVLPSGGPWGWGTVLL